MNENKTQATAGRVSDFLAAVVPERRRRDGERLVQIFREVTGFEPKMWGPTIIGFGRYHYRYESGREGEICATGFSPRKANLVVYIMPGYGDFGDLMDRLGKHKLGKSCLYLNNLDDVDEEVLRELIAAGLKDLATRWQIFPD